MLVKEPEYGTLKTVEYFKINEIQTQMLSETKIITVVYDGNMTNLLVSNGYEIATTNGVFSSSQLFR